MLSLTRLVVIVLAFSSFGDTGASGEECGVGHITPPDPALTGVFGLPGLPGLEGGLPGLDSRPPALLRLMFIGEFLFRRRGGESLNSLCSLAVERQDFQNLVYQTYIKC